MRDAFVSEFKKGDFNAGLIAGADTIAQELKTAQSETGGRLRQAEGPPVAAFPCPGRPIGGPGVIPRALAWAACSASGS